MIEWKPLLRRPSLQHQESLPSFVHRISKANYYEPTTMLKMAVLSGLSDHQLWQPHDTAVFERLAILTTLPVDELFDATAHSFAPVIIPPNATTQRNYIIVDATQYQCLQQRVSAYQMRPANDAQYCPQCLKESLYHRRSWFPITVSTCIKHQCLLVYRCPLCHKRLRVQDVVDGRCRHCEYGLAEAKTVSLTDDKTGMFAQHSIQSWLGLVESPVSEEGIPRKSNAILYRIVDGIRQSIMQFGKSWDSLHRIDTLGSPLPCKTKSMMTPTVSYQLYATAVKALIDWPNGFYEFLTAYRFGNPRTSFRQGLQNDFGTLYTQWLLRYWQDDIYAFIQDAFDDYLIDNGYQHLPATRRSRRQYTAEASHFVTATEAMRLLSVSEVTMKRLIKRDVLISHKTPDGFIFVEVEEVERLRQAWQNAVSLDECASRLKTTDDVVKALIEIGLLHSVRGQEATGGFLWLISNESLVDLRQALRNQMRLSIKGITVIDLIKASQILHPLSIGLVVLIQQIILGRLPLVAIENNEWGLSNLRVSLTDVDALVIRTRQERGWLTRNETAARLGIKPVTLSKWVQSKLLEPVITHGHTQFFQEADVDAFITSHVNTDEASEILGIGRLAVQAWARAGRLRAVSGRHIDGCHRYLFRRVDVELLRPENRLSVSETIAFLGISRAKLMQWISDGRVKPVSGKGIDDMKHYLFLRSEIKDLP